MVSVFSFVGEIYIFSEKRQTDVLLEVFPTQKTGYHLHAFPKDEKTRRM